MVPPAVRAGVDHALRYAVVGSPETVRQGLASLLDQTAADEVMVTAQIFDQAARRRSYGIVARARDALASVRQAA